jgi:hypothetical protein
MRTNTTAAEATTSTKSQTSAQARPQPEAITFELTTDQAARASQAAAAGEYGTLERFAAFAVDYVAENIMAGNRLCIPLAEGELAAWSGAYHRSGHAGTILEFVRDTVNRGIQHQAHNAAVSPPAVGADESNILPFHPRRVIHSPDPMKKPRIARPGPSKRTLPTDPARSKGAAAGQTPPPRE